MERREFLIKTCMSCATLAGMSFLFTECKTTSILETNDEISLPISAMKGKNNLLIKSEKRQENILLVRQKDETFQALQMKCTHKGAPLEQNGEELVCPAHGSRFDLEGNVVKSPAAKPLKKYSVSESEEKLRISFE